MTSLLAMIVILGDPGVVAITVVLLALVAHVGILVNARRHSRYTSDIALWGLVVAVGVQVAVAMAGFASFGVLFVPSILLSVALLIVAFKRRSRAAQPSVVK